MEIEDFYKGLSLGDSSKRIQNTLLQTHWYLSNAVFDSNSGMAVPQNLTEFLKVVRSHSAKGAEGPLRDRIWRIFRHSQKALLHLMDCLNENPKREHESLPLRDVKELDAACFIKLSTRPGLTIREKIASKPHVMAVKRYQSIDLPENQLLKAFVIKLKKLLLLRKECIIAAGVDFKRFAIFEEEDAVVNRINHWLRSEECKSISRWNNLPPNNTILSHREYKRVWAAWRWMQALPRDIEDDLMHYGFREMTIYNWELLAKVRNGSNLRVVEVPLLFNFERFSILPYNGPYITIFLKDNPRKLSVKHKISIPGLQLQQQEPKEYEPIQDPVCVDFARVNPIFCHSDIVDVLPYKMLWQKWSMDSKQTLERTILSADIVQCGPGIFTISARDIFASSQADNLDLQQAIFQLSTALTLFFKSSDFIWLVPDIVNDFQLTSLQSCIHSLYGNEQHIPRSIAAVFEYVDFGEIQKDDEIVVVDRIGKRLFSTKLIVRYSQSIEKKLPEIRGFYFERRSSEDIRCIPSECEYSFTGGTLEYDYLAEKDLLRQKNCQRQEIGVFNGQNKLFLILGDAPVRGGMKFIKLQSQIPTESLWTDCLPDLSTLIPDKNGYCHFYFVKDAKINVKAGQKTTLETGNTFILPPFQKQYAFPLYQGRADGRKASEYTALLKSSQFPLQKKITCSLAMTYTYGGKANPYELTFVPNDPKILPITVQWVKTSELQYNKENLKYPAYPKPKTWADYENWTGSRNLLNDLLGACKSFCNPKRVDYSPNASTSYSFVCGSLDSNIKINKTGRRYCFVSDGSAESYYSPEQDDYDSNCAWDENIDSVEYGTKIFFIVKKYQNVKDDSKSKTTAVCLSLSEEYVKDKLRVYHAIEEEKQRTRLEKHKQKNENDRQRRINKICSPAIVIWRDGNSLCNAGVPNAFKMEVSSFIEKMENMLEQPDLDDEYRKDVIKFLCILHKDCPESVRKKVENRFANNNSNAFQDYKNLAYLIGDCSEPWQKEFLYQFISWSKENKFALSCLSIVLWRSENIVFLINMGDCLDICRNLYRNIDRLLEKIKEGLSDQDREKNKVLSALCRNLETLFAFIRLRGSNDPEKASFFTPNNKISAAFVYELDKLNTVLLEKQLTLRSNLSIRVENKPSGLESMPDIIYSLRSFLTGEMGTICVESVEDEDADLSDMED